MTEASPDLSTTTSVPSEQIRFVDDFDVEGSVVDLGDVGSVVPISRKRSIKNERMDDTIEVFLAPESDDFLKQLDIQFDCRDESFDPKGFFLLA